MSLSQYTLPLSAGSSLWMYEPERDAAAAEGWNASYTGSPVWPPGGGKDIGNGSQFFRTQNSGASVGIEFTGIGLLLCFRDNNASYALSIDGRQVDPQNWENDAACHELGATNTLRIGDLDFTSHSVVLNVTASDNAEFQFFGGVLETKVAVDRDGDEATEVTIDDRDENWIMQRLGDYKWDLFEDPLAINGTGSFICPYTASMTATYKFKGASAIVFYGNPARDTHDFSIILDQKIFSSDASVSGWTLPSTVYFFQAGLNADREYILTYRNYADRKTYCTMMALGGRYCCSRIDAFKLLGSATKLAHFSGTLSGTQNSHKSNTGAVVVGGVVGGFVVAAIIVATVFLGLRRHRRQGNYRTQFRRNSHMQFSPYQFQPMSVAQGTVGSNMAHVTPTPFAYPLPASSHTLSVPPPVTLVSGAPVRGKRPTTLNRMPNSSGEASGFQQVDQPFDLVSPAGGTLPPAYSSG